MRSRKLPRSPAPPPPDVRPPENAEDAVEVEVKAKDKAKAKAKAKPARKEKSAPLRISGTRAEPPREEDYRNEDGTFKGRPPNADTPAAKAKIRKSLQVSRALQNMLGMTPQQYEQAASAPQTVADQIAARLLNAARGGTMDAIKTVYDRTEGRVPQALDINQHNAQKEVDERVSDIARDRLNAAAFAATGVDGEDAVSDTDPDEAKRDENVKGDSASAG
jgi:hypothetical protein